MNTRRRFSDEFKSQAVALLDTGKPPSEIAEELENDILKKAAVILGTKPQPKRAR